MIVLVLFFVLIVPPAWGANHYIRDGGSASTSGTGACTSWATANACDNLPSTLVRGDTYYIADGSYAGRTFSTAASGTTTITIKKATVADHGTSTGWDDAYGDGACPASTCAQFTSSLNFTTPYWVVDGVAGGGPSNWTGGFGFQVTETGSTTPIVTLSADTADNVTISHIRLIGLGAGGGGGSQANDCLAVFGASNTTISYYYMSGCGRCPFFLSATNFIAEYGYTGQFYAEDPAHSELASVWNFAGPTPSNITFRHNLFTYATSTGGLIFEADDVRVYGNVFWKDPNLPTWTFGNGVIGSWTSSTMSNSVVYNNTFINLDTVDNSDAIAPLGTFTGTVGRNNLFYNVEAVGSVPTWSHNHFISTSANGTNSSTGSGDPFVDISGLDFRLTAPTTAGSTLASPFDTDPLGVTRGADGTWDRGAFDFVAGGGGGSSHAISGSVSLSGGVVMQ